MDRSIEKGGEKGNFPDYYPENGGNESPVKHDERVMESQADRLLFPYSSRKTILSSPSNPPVSVQINDTLSALHKGMGEYS